MEVVKVARVVDVAIHVLRTPFDGLKGLVKANIAVHIGIADGKIVHVSRYEKVRIRVLEVVVPTPLKEDNGSITVVLPRLKAVFMKAILAQD